MRGKAVEVSAFEAKTRLSALLRETEQGSSFVICRRGKPVARLVPVAVEVSRAELGDIVAVFRQIRKQTPGTVKVRRLIEEGRRA